MRMTLRENVLLPVLAISALLAGYLFAWWMPRQLRELEAEVGASAQSHLASIAEIAASYLEQRRPEAVYELLDTLHGRDAGWVAVELMGPDGSVVFPRGPAKGERRTGLDELVLRQPITFHGAELGHLEARYDVGRKLAIPRKRHGELVLASMLVEVCYVAMLWLLLERKVRRPLAALSHASTRLAAGEFDTPLGHAGAREVDALADSFSAMREAIRDYQAELVAKNDSLKSLSEAVGQSPISVVITDREGRIEFANGRFYALNGQTPAGAIGRPCEVMSGACVPEARREEVRRAIAAGSCWRGEVQRKGPDGRPCHGSVFLSPVRDESGAIAHWLVNMEDVTHERALEQQLAQAQKMEALGTLAGGIAHDFNNVLSPIIGYTELARTHAGVDPELSEDLAQVSEAAFRARDLVRQILTFSRKAEKKKVPLHVATVAEEALKLLRSTIPATIEFRTEFIGDGRVLADPTQIHQVVMNLCTNAFHAMEETGGALAVSVRERDISPEKAVGSQLLPGRYAVLSVSDTGVGMDRETLSRIFDPYFTTKAKGKGTGLGLAVVDGIVRDHDGRVSVYSEPGYGTTFRVYLPLTAAVASAARPGAPERRTARAAGSERVLVVDDEESIRSIVGRTLRDAGYRVTVAANGGEALELLLRCPSDCELLITDMTMPGINGKELAKRAMELRPGLPVILCCGYSSLITAEGALRMGIQRYVEKPVEMRDLLEIIRQVLDGASVRTTPAA